MTTDLYPTVVFCGTIQSQTGETRRHPLVHSITVCILLKAPNMSSASLFARSVARISFAKVLQTPNLVRVGAVRHSSYFTPGASYSALAKASCSIVSRSPLWRGLSGFIYWMCIVLWRLDAFNCSSLVSSPCRYAGLSIDLMVDHLDVSHS